MNLDKKVIIRSKNNIDYRRFHWWILLFLVTVGSSLLWALFKFSLIVLPIFIVIILKLQNAFKINIVVSSNRIKISKTFFGLSYFGLKYSFNKIIWHSDGLKLLFLAEKKAPLSFLLNESGLLLQRQKKHIYLGDAKIAPKLLEQILEAPLKLDLINFYHFN